MRTLFVIAALCCLPGCPSEVPPTNTEEERAPAETLVAIHDADRVTLAELQDFLDGFPAHRQAEVAPPEGRRGFLRNYLLYRTALRRAEAAGYGDDPRVRRARDRAMARHWTEDRLDSTQPPPITDGEMRTRWEKTKTPDRPDRVRARHILLGDLPAAEALREDLLAALARPGVDAEAIFAAAARDHSLDGKTRARGGDLLFFSRGGDEVAWRLAPPVALEAALATHTTGQVSRPIPGPDGIHLVMVTARREAEQPVFEDAKDALRAAIAAERAAAAREALEAELLDMDDWTVDDEALRGLGAATTTE